MITDKPKLEANIDDKLYDSYQQWKRDNALTSDSQALNYILGEYLNQEQLSDISGIDNRLSLLEQQFATISKQLAQIANSNVKGKKTSVISPKSTTGKESKGNKNAENNGASAKSLNNPSISQESSNFEDGLTQNQLAERLQTTYKTVWKHRQRGQEHFAQWTQEQDPDQLAWDDGTREKGRGNQVFFRPLI